MEFTNKFPHKVQSYTVVIRTNEIKMHFFVELILPLSTIYSLIAYSYNEIQEPVLKLRYNVMGFFCSELLAYL